MKGFVTNQKSSIPRLFLIGTVLMSLICFDSDLLPKTQASQGSPQGQLRISEISNP
jgi:hypothetical protein